MSHNNHVAGEGRGRHPREQPEARQAEAVQKVALESKTEDLMEEVIGRENMRRAWGRVKRNGGAPGVDGMNIDACETWLKDNWLAVKVDLLEDRYQPSPVKGVKIPKPGGKGMRQLGIPTVLDRLIQQALLQILTPIFDPSFSERSYGFRPGRSAHDAVQQARLAVAKGKRWVVDLDLEKFFDRVNHDILMSRLMRKIKDKRVLRLIRRYLRAGLMEKGITSAREQGTPQGGPLSPLLSNVLLDELDKELEQRGHEFCRYADDCNIYVGSKASGERVLNSVTQFLEQRLKLKVNPEKSAVDRPWKRKFLGYSITWDKSPKLKVARASVTRLRAQLKLCFRQGRGCNLFWFIQKILTPKLRGWLNYFRHSDVKGVFEELDKWIRRRLRLIIWRHWKRPRTRYRRMLSLGMLEERARASAYNGRGAWYNAGASHMNWLFRKSYFDERGLVSLKDEYLSFKRH